MFRSFKNQSRAMFWLTIVAAIGGITVITVILYLFPKILLKFVSGNAGS